MKTNYASISNEYAKKETSKVVVIPVPYKGTNTWQQNSHKGPQAFLEASNYIELYDIETDSEAYKQGIFLADEVAENNSAEAMSLAVYENVKSYLKTNKFVSLIGGDHAVVIGAIKAFNEHYENLTVLQIDAHARLHKEVNGNKVNNQCAMYHASQATNLIQVGVRSMASIEKTVVDTDKTYFANELATDDYWMENAIEAMTENVVISLSLDGLDPSIMPGVDKPVPGGLFWYEILEFLKSVFTEKNVVGINLVGLSPLSTDKSSEALAAKLFYKMLSYKYELEKEDNLEISENTFSKNENKVGKFNNEEE
ncbi:agmatinase [Wenyingzhuangia heitensis]|uniref:Agmatinase n=1 Tax=Wenyingzhuangia heitensis TaxID=1487859 RepID=A0ABX0UBH7_9FLAO|nr:arginase family protein [Wenyingzhuangia heitensis]NIJ46088.1 agmatinase [Wenyingzhuangia heitensis]